MSMNVLAGPLIPVKAVTGLAPQGYVAQPVHTYHTIPDGQVVQGMPTAQPVVYITAVDLVQNGGNYQLVGAPVALPVYDGHSLAAGAGAPLIVYEA